MKPEEDGVPGVEPTADVAPDAEVLPPEEVAAPAAPEPGMVKVRILHGLQTGSVEIYPQPAAESAILSGFAEAVVEEEEKPKPDEPEPAPEPEPEPEPEPHVEPLPV